MFNISVNNSVIKPRIISVIIKKSETFNKKKKEKLSLNYIAESPGKHKFKIEYLTARDTER